MIEANSSTARDPLIQHRKIQLSEFKMAPQNNNQLQRSKQDGPQTIVDDTFQQPILQLTTSSKPQPILQPSPQEQQQTFTNFWDFFKIACILSIASLDVGYSLAQIATIPDQVLVESYNSPFTGYITNALLMGIWPLGGMFGAVVCWNLLKIWRKKRIYYFLGVLSLASAILIQITTFQTIIIGRFILGITSGMYPMIGPIMTMQLVPTSLISLMGCFFSLGRTFGMVLAFGIGVIFQVATVNEYWRIILIIPGIFGALQTLTVFLYIPDTPKQLIKNGQTQALNEMISKYYKKEQVQKVIASYQKTYDMQNQSNKSAHQGQDPYKSNKLRAFIMAIHINIFTNFNGINTTFILSSSVMDRVVPAVGIYANFINNVIRMPLNIFAAFWLVKRVGRRPLLVWSALILSICNYLIAIGYFTNSLLEIFLINLLFSIIFGIMYNPVMLTYPAEIIPAGEYIIANVFNQASMAITLLLPPIILKLMDQNGQALFMFYGVYTTASFVYMFFYLKESKGLKYDQIVKSY